MNGSGNKWKLSTSEFFFNLLGYFQLSSPDWQNTLMSILLSEL